MLSAPLTEVNLSGELDEEDWTVAEGVAAGGKAIRIGKFAAWVFAGFVTVCISKCRATNWVGRRKEPTGRGQECDNQTAMLRSMSKHQSRVLVGIKTRMTVAAASVSKHSLKGCCALKPLQQYTCKPIVTRVRPLALRWGGGLRIGRSLVRFTDSRVVPFTSGTTWGQVPQDTVRTGDTLKAGE